MNNPQQWAVSVVLTLQKLDGKINVMNHLHQVTAVSRDEAVGKAVEISMKQKPEHQVHCFTALPFKSSAVNNPQQITD